MDAAPRYAQADLIRLRDDPEFQRRVGADEELARLFNPRCEDTEIRAELAQSLGMGRRVAGVDLPPVRLGSITLLTAVGNEFAKSRPAWGDMDCGQQLGQLTEALFVLANGPKAVVPFADLFRFRRTIDAWRKDAATSPHIAAACMDAERKAAGSLRLWDAAVLTWGAANVCLTDDETLPGAIVSVNEWIERGLEGFKLFPDIQKPEEVGAAKPVAPFGWTRKLRRASSRALVRCALALLPKRPDGRHH